MKTFYSYSKREPYAPENWQKTSAISMHMGISMSSEKCCSRCQSGVFFENNIFSIFAAKASRKKFPEQGQGTHLSVSGQKLLLPLGKFNSIEYVTSTVISISYYLEIYPITSACENVRNHLSMFTIAIVRA